MKELKLIMDMYDRCVIFYLILVTFSGRLIISLRQPLTSNSITETVLGSMTYEIILQYFYHYKCIVVITDSDSSIIEYIPKELPIYHILIGQKLIPEVEEVETFEESDLNDSTRIFDHLLIKTLDARCLGYIIQVTNPRSIVLSFSRSSRKSIQRENRRYIYLPKTDEFIYDVSTGTITNIFDMKEMDIMPDSVVVRFLKLNVCDFNFFNISQSSEDSVKVERKCNKKQSNSHVDDANIISQSFLRKTMEYTTSTNQHQELNLSEIEKLNENFVDQSKLEDVFADCENYGIDFEVVTQNFLERSPSQEIILDIWIGEKRKFLHSANLFLNKLSNLQGKELNAAVVDYKPYVILNCGADSHAHDGIEVRILGELGRILNFTWNLIVDDNLWGEIYANGSGNGIFGRVVQDEVEFGFAALYGTWHHEWSWTDFSQSYVRSAMKGVTPRPHLLPSWQVPILPFSWDIWLSVLGTILLSTIIIYFLAKSSEHFLGGTGSVGPYASLSGCALYTFGMLVLQVYEGRSEQEMHLPMRLLITILDMMVHTLSSIYSGGLASILTIPRYGRPIDTLTELAASNLLWAAQSEAFIWSIQDTDDPVLQIIVKDFRTMGEEELAVKAKQAKIGFVIEQLSSGGTCSIGSHLTQEDAAQKFRTMKEPLYWAHVVMITRKGSPFMNSLNSLIYALKESGIIQYWETVIALKYHTDCIKSADMNLGPTQLTLDHVQGAFISLLIGLSLAFVVFIAEMISEGLKGVKKRKTGLVRPK